LRLTFGQGGFEVVAGHFHDGLLSSRTRISKA
jgi:hypothetical protein